MNQVWQVSAGSVDLRHLVDAALHCSYILNSVRFRTDSNSVRKQNLKKFNKIFRTKLDSVWKQKTIFKPRKSSEPNPIPFGKKKQYFRGKHSEPNTVWFGKKCNICSSAHLFICSSDHSNIDMILQIFDEQRHESENV